MDQQTITMLKDPDPQTRLRAVKALAATHDAAALRYLATVYRQDSDPRVREAARRAGVYLRENGIDPVPTKAAPTPDVPLPPPPASPAQQAKARALVEQAVALNLQGKRDKALKAITRALALDPALKGDTYTAGAAAAATGLGPEEAITMAATFASSGAVLRKGGQVSAGHKAAIAMITTLAVALGVSLVLPWVQLPESFAGSVINANGLRMLGNVGDIVQQIDMFAVVLYLIPLVVLGHTGLGAYLLLTGGEPDSDYWLSATAGGVLSAVAHGWFFLFMSGVFGTGMDAFGIGYLMGVGVSLLLAAAGAYGLLVRP